MGLSGGAGLVESNGLVGDRVSGESHNLGPQSLRRPECLSGPPRTACGEVRKSSSCKGVSCFAFSSWCGSCVPFPLGVSEIAAGSESEVHLRESHRSEPPVLASTSFLGDNQTDLLWRMLHCCCCWQPLPWL